jgi:DNA-binding NtrC family response regulator
VIQVTDTKLPNLTTKIKSAETANVLLVSQAPDLERLVLETLARKGIQGMVAGDAEAAIDFLDKNDCALVLADETIPSRAGACAAKDAVFELLNKISSSWPELPVVFVAGNDDHGAHTRQQTIEMVVKAMRAGFCDCLSQPVGREKFEKLLDKIVPNRPVQTIASTEEGTGCLYKIVGKSPNLIQTVALAKKVAPTSVPILISGESGTGKELISYVVHYNSKRALGPFIKVNCAALSETLLESELFGHEKGAFTGAYSQRKGRFEAAHGGTLLLDEISETPLRFQAKLLRVLEQQDLQRVGSNDNIKVDVRVISTTNKDLSQGIAEGLFRQDLYYRLCGIRLVVDPIRQRKEDLPDLCWHFVNLYAGQAQRRITRLDPAMMELFSKYHWPGNVRQLRNVILTSLILGVGETLSLADASWLFNELQPLPEITEAFPAEHARLGEASRSRAETAEEKNNLISANSAVSAVNGELAGVPLAHLERRAILETLKQTNGNQTKAAKVLGISDRTLRDKIKRYRQEKTLQPA